MKPQFLFVGPTKSGTTWIDAYLRSRGDVSLPDQTKETFFFDKVYDKGIDWYESQFDAGQSKRICVEVAPSLFHKPAAAERAAAHLPGAHIICTVRDPIDRAISHYFHYRKAGEPSRPLLDMVQAKPDLITPGLYERNVSVWIEKFGAANVHFLYYEDLSARPDQFCRELCALLGLPFIAPGAELRENSVNEAGVPRNRLVAKVIRRISDALRLAGANRIVNAVKSDRLKAMVFSGGGNLAEERQAIRSQSAALAPYFSEDQKRFEQRIARQIASKPRMPAASKQG